MKPNSIRMAANLLAIATSLLLCIQISPISGCSPEASPHRKHLNDTNANNLFKQLTNILAEEQANLHETTSIYQQQQQQSIISSKENSINDDGQSTTLSSSMLKTFIRANDMRVYHLDLHSYRPEAKYSGDARFVDSENLQHLARCSKHLEQYDQLLASFHNKNPILNKNSLASLKLADTFGRPEAGLLTGNQFWLGSYDSCLDLQVIRDANDGELVGSQYCLGMSQFKNWNPSDSKTSVKVGLCLPETCSTSMLNENRNLFKLTERMMKYQFGSSEGPYGSLKLRSIYCLPHETSEVRQYSLSALAFMAVVGFFACASIAATIVDYMNSKSNEALKQSLETSNNSSKGIMIESFSLIRNLNKFLYIRPESGEEKIASPACNGEQAKVVDDAADQFNRSTFLDCITGLKCIGLFWIIIAHTFLVAPIASKNIIDADKLTQTYLADVYLASHLMVDTFFCLSGMLAAYFIFREGIETIKFKHWAIMTVHRYWRLTPIYLLCYWFTKSVGFLTSSGPLWDYMTSEASPRLNCNRESWFMAILQLSDFKSPKEHCVPFAWFIANGIKFWILTPIFLIAIHKSMKKGYIISLATLLANIILVFSLAKRSSVDVKSIIEFKPESANNMLNNMGEIYTRPYSRIGAYIIGLLAGHFMFLIDSNQLKLKISSNTNKLLWSMFVIVTTVSVFVLKIANLMKLDESAMPIVFGATSALIRPLWSFCTCWLIFALAHNQLQPIARFLSANCWKILVKLSFCAYLVQGEVIAQLFLARSSADSFTYSDLITKPINTIILTLCVAFIMVMILEYPLCGIEKLILPSRESKKQQQQQQQKNKPMNEDAKLTLADHYRQLQLQKQSTPVTSDRQPSIDTQSVTDLKKLKSS